jgi:steroid Delta-isomerase
MPSPDAIETVIKTYFAATRERDLETWIDTFAEDAISSDPVGGTPLTGREEIYQYLLNFLEKFDRIGFAEEFVHITDNEAAVKWTGRGIGKNGQEIIFEGITIFRVNEAGKIQTLRAYWQPIVILTELKETL